MIINEKDLMIHGGSIQHRQKPVPMLFHIFEIETVQQHLVIELDVVRGNPTSPVETWSLGFSTGAAPKPSYRLDKVLRSPGRPHEPLKITLRGMAKVTMQLPKQSLHGLVKLLSRRNNKINAARIDGRRLIRITTNRIRTIRALHTVTFNSTNNLFVVPQKFITLPSAPR
jgi:hypothetical protein